MNRSPDESSGQGALELIRDRWGIAHVYAECEEGAFYGTGYAMAEDRLFQMTLLRRQVQGRLAELLGPGEEGRYVDSDQKYRILGFHLHAQRLQGHLLPDTRINLDAFAAGVNAYLADHRGQLPEIFTRYGADPSPWNAADCIALWALNAYAFTAGWEGEVAAKRAAERRPAADPGAPFLRDETTAIVSEAEFQRAYPHIYQRLKEVVPPSVTDPDLPSDPGRKASHNWVVSGHRSQTGKPILESNPQIPVSFPGLFYEIHLAGGRYDVRGAAIPGTPGILIGWNRHAAWGMTALGGDHADLFEEQAHPDNPDLYLHNGEWKAFDTRTETVRVRDGSPIELRVRQTLHGPVVNDLLDDTEPGELFALQHTLYDPRRSSLEAMMQMMRATDWTSFRSAMSGYVAPPAHLIYADVKGDIGYQSLGSTPKRFGPEPLPRKGWTGREEWEHIPFEEMPSMVNPESDAIFTANHLPVGSWYPYLITTSRGEGPRAWRLRELLATDRKLSVEDFHTQIHLDAVNPALRNFVRLATAVVEEDGTTNPETVRAVEALKAWDFRLLTDAPAYPLARSVLDVLQAQADTGTPFQDRYADRWNGLVWLLKDLGREFHNTGQTPQTPEVRRWLTESLQTAVTARSPEHRPPVTHRMPYQDNLSRLGSVAADYDLVSPPLQCPGTQTIWSQAGETYVQIVDLADLDRSLSLLPPGVSEDPDSLHATDQIPAWVEGTLHPAPMTRPAVEADQESVIRLAYPKQKQGVDA